MDDLVVRKAPLSWWAAGIFLGLVQVLAVGLQSPLGVSTQFVVADAKVINKVAPQYVQNHPLISSEKYQRLGYGWWLDIGLLIGAFIAAVAARRWKIRLTTVWARANQQSIAARFIIGLIAGFLILLGARFAHGCTSGQFASGWAQLSLSAVPFTITMFAFGMITAKILYPKSPDIEK